MFTKCSKLEKLPDLSKWKTDKVTEMTYMFYRCKSLKSLPDISGWNTKNVRDMLYMFGSCTSLERLPDFSNWNFKPNVYGVFPNCNKNLNYPKNIKN